MFKVALRGLRSHTLRLLATVLAVLLGVSFMVGTQVLGDTVKASFDEAFADVNRGVDAVVRSDTEISSGLGGERPRIQDEIVDQVAAQDEVSSAEGQIRRPVRLVSPEDEQTSDPTRGPPTFGLNWPEVAELNQWTLVEGSAPEPDQVVLDRRSALDDEVDIGDAVSVETAAGLAEFEVSGIARFGELDTLAGAPAVLMATSTAQELLAQPGQFDWITATAEPGTSQGQLAEQLQAALPEGVEAITGDQFTEETAGPFRDFIDQFTAFITAFGVIALFVGGFIIFNTFAVLVAQRTRELALLRAIGASRRQVLGSVVGEAAGVGILAVVLGAGAGVALATALRQLLEALGLSLPPRPLEMEPMAFAVPMLLGVAVTVASALVPAVRASKIAPVAAMVSAAIDRSARSLWRVVIGAVAAVGAAALLVAGTLTEEETALQLTGASLLATFVAVTALGPLFLRPSASVLGAPLALITTISGKLATLNSRRNPARTSVTASALTIGVGLVAVIAIAASSASASISRTTERTFPGDMVVRTDFLRLPPALAEELEDLEEVDIATGLRITDANVDGDRAILLGLDLSRVAHLVEMEVTEGSLEALDSGGLAVSPEVADDLDASLGEEVDMTFRAAGEQSLELRAILDATLLSRVASYVVGQATFDDLVPESDRFDWRVLVSFDDEADPLRARAAVEEVVSAYPAAEAEDLDDLIDSQAAQIDQGVALLYSLLGLSVLIALIGVVNTLVLSVHERTREIGLLRAVGMGRRQIAGTVLAESVVIALVGTVLGLAIGTGFGVALFAALARAEPDLSTLSLPFGELGIVFGAGVVAGSLAGLYPAWRASRLKVLEAIATE